MVRRRFRWPLLPQLRLVRTLAAVVLLVQRRDMVIGFVTGVVVAEKGEAPAVPGEDDGETEVAKYADDGAATGGCGAGFMAWCRAAATPSMVIPRDTRSLSFLTRCQG